MNSSLVLQSDPCKFCYVGHGVIEGFIVQQIEVYVRVGFFELGDVVGHYVYRTCICVLSCELMELVFKKKIPC